MCGRSAGRGGRIAHCSRYRTVRRDHLYDRNARRRLTARSADTESAVRRETGYCVVAARHKRIVPSRLPDATIFPSGDTARHCTPFV